MVLHNSHAVEELEEEPEPEGDQQVEGEELGVQAGSL